jgi:capsular polysaccharide biosynthesis protein
MEFVNPKIGEVLKSCMAKNYHLENIGIKEFENAYILPYTPEICRFAGVADSDGNFIENSAVHEGLFRDKINPVLNPEHIDSEVIFIGSMHSIYGHCITDNLKKLWFLRTDKGQRIIENGGKIAYVSAWNNEELPQFALHILTLAGIDTQKLIRITSPTRVKKVYIPDNSMQLKNGTRMWSDQFKKEFEIIKSNIRYTGETYDKIYFSRTQLKDNKDFGEKRIEKLFEEQGYKILSPEKLSIDAQVALMTNCKNFVGTDGSITHNGVFCNKDTEITILIKADYANGYQMMINDMIGYQVTYVSAHHTIKHRRRPWSGPFYLSPTKELLKYLNKKKNTDWFWLRGDWYKYLYERFFH